MKLALSSRSTFCFSCLGWRLLSLALLLAFGCTSARAELIPVSTIETPTKLDLRLTWNEDGSEPTFVVPGLEHWRVQISAIEPQTVVEDWVFKVDIGHLTPGEETFTSSWGGLTGVFGADQLGLVVNETGVLLHGFPPVPAGGAFGNGPPPIDTISLRVERLDIDDGGFASIVTISAHHVPEPGSAALALALTTAAGVIGFSSSRPTGRLRIGRLAVVVIAMCLSADVARAEVAFHGTDVIAPNTPEIGSPGTSTVYGWEFVAQKDLVVTHLGWLDRFGNGFLDAHGVSIWSVEKELLASAVVPQGTSADLVGAFRFVEIPPTSLLSGKTYVIGGLQPYKELQQPLPGVEIPLQWDPLVAQVMPPQTSPHIEFVTGRLMGSDDRSGSVYFPEFAYLLPAQSGHSIWLGPNFQFSTVPEPSAAVMALGAGFVAIVRFVMRRRYLR